MSTSERKEEGESQAELITIGFGSIHTYAEDEDLKYVILDVGENGWFEASQIIGNRLGFPGTGSASDIGKIVGSMSLEEVLKGLARTMGGNSESMEAEIKRFAQKPSRILTR